MNMVIDDVLIENLTGDIAEDMDIKNMNEPPGNTEEEGITEEDATRIVENDTGVETTEEEQEQVDAAAEKNTEDTNAVHEPIKLSFRLSFEEQFKHRVALKEGKDGVCII